MPSYLRSRKILSDTLIFLASETQLHMQQWYVSFIKPVVDFPSLNNVDQVRITVLQNRTAIASTVAKFKTLGSVERELYEI